MVALTSEELWYCPSVHTLYLQLFSDGSPNPGITHSQQHFQLLGAFGNISLQEHLEVLMQNPFMGQMLRCQSTAISQL